MTAKRSAKVIKLQPPLCCAEPTPADMELEEDDIAWATRSGMWQSRYGGSPEAIGARLVFDGNAFTVVGVAPPGFRLAGDVDVFTPIGQDTTPPMQSREMHPGIQVMARLRAGVPLAQARWL